MQTMAHVNAALKLQQGAPGFTYKADGTQPTKGYAVAESGAPVLRITNFSRTNRHSAVVQLHNWLNRNGKALKGKMLGGWYDREADVYEVEPSVLVTEKRRAIRHAKANNQIAVFNLSTGEEIRTGGTGNR